MPILTRALTIAVVGLIASGCGGGGTAEVTSSAPELVAQAATALSETESYRARFDGTIGLTGGEALTGGLVGEDQAISGEARISGESAAVDLAADLGITQLQATLTRTENGVWLGVLGSDYSLDLPAETQARLEPRRLAPAVVGWISEPTITGTDSIDGVDVAVVSGSVDPDALLADIGAVSGAAVDPAAQQQVRDALTKGEIVMSVGIDDLLPRSLDVDVVLDGRIDALDAEAASLDLTATLTDFGGEVTIEEPRNAQPFSLDDLGPFAP